jgi:hypothetical protein
VSIGSERKAPALTLGWFDCRNSDQIRADCLNPTDAELASVSNWLSKIDLSLESNSECTEFQKIYFRLPAFYPISTQYASGNPIRIRRRIFSVERVDRQRKRYRRRFLLGL